MSTEAQYIQGAGLAHGLGQAPSKLVKPPQFFEDTAAKLDVQLERLRGISDRTRNLADRIFGGLPEEASCEKIKAYSTGAAGTIAEQVDKISSEISYIEAQLARFSQL